jgi:autotransporter translocation and assembly factor TamB
MKRVLKNILTTALSLVAVLIVTLVSVLVFVAGTESGTRFAWRHAQKILPPGVEIAGLEGRIAGPLEIRGLKIANAAFQRRLARLPGSAGSGRLGSS